VTAPDNGRAAPAADGSSARILAVVTLSFSSGLPLGLVWTLVPTWMALAGFDIKTVGLFTLATLPWSLKPLWSPLLDRFAPPLLGRKRGWVLLAQLALIALGLGLALAARPPINPWVIAVLALLVAFASATQDIAYDAYAVEVLRQEDYGTAVGARTAFARAGMFVSQRLAVSAAAWTTWPVIHTALALLYVPFLAVTWKAPEPERPPAPPRSLREAVWGPFLGFLAQHRALEILAFVVLYKLSDNLTQALTGPFLVQLGFDEFAIGVASGTVGLAALLAGTYLGARLSDRLGLGRALWLFGFLQIASNLGYAVVAQLGPAARPWVLDLSGLVTGARLVFDLKQVTMYAAQAFEMGSSGLGSGAFGVLLMRLTQKRFSATQYALLSSLFALPRVISGPSVGLLADALGWRDFFISTVLAGLPGMWMLARFVPWGARDVAFQVAAVRQAAALPRHRLIMRAALVGLATWAAALGLLALLAAVKLLRGGGDFAWLAALMAHVWPTRFDTALAAFGAALCGLMAGLATAAALVARHGQGVGSGEAVAEGPRDA
jgi:PAT family beta-lactamase induction signal transducer AmpG